MLLGLGAILLLLGSALSYQQIIRPILEWLSDLSDQFFNELFPNHWADLFTHFFGGLLLVLGMLCVYLGVRRVFLHLFETINPGINEGRLGERYRSRQRLAYGPKIVALGGGTGLSTLLRGLKKHTSNITAVVTVTDDGGSSGQLSKEIGITPPGDIRNCLAALADSERLTADLFQYRFKSESSFLSGHSLGNLLLTALYDLSGKNFEQAVEAASKVLSISGRVMPSTLDKVGLHAILMDGRELFGETKIVAARSPIRQILLDPPHAQPNPAVLEAIEDADLIIIGPGSVYTSLIPNLLVPGVSDAIANSKAKKVFICNVMTQPGESDSYSASEHVAAVQANISRKVFEYVMINSASPDLEAVEKYRASGQYTVVADCDRVSAMGYRVIQGDFMSVTNVVRHDPAKIADRIIDLVHK